MELETGYVILGRFQRFKGYTVFNCKEHGPELHDLEPGFRAKLSGNGASCTGCLQRF